MTLRQQPPLFLVQYNGRNYIFKDKPLDGSSDRMCNLYESVDDVDDQYKNVSNVLLKVPKESDDSRETIDNEAERCSSLGIDYFIGKTKVRNQPALLLHKLPGKSLDERLTIEEKEEKGEKYAFVKKVDSFYDSLEIIVGIFQELDKIHPHKYVHSDPAPNNVRRLPDGRIRLLDYGLCREVGLDITKIGSQQNPRQPRNITNYLNIGETGLHHPIYYFPEVLDVHAKAELNQDVYGFGCLATLLLAGTQMRYIQKKRSAPPKVRTHLSALLHHFHQTVAPATLEEMASLLMKATDLDPAKRHKDAAEVLQQLVRFSWTIPSHPFDDVLKNASSPSSSFVYYRESGSTPAAEEQGGLKPKKRRGFSFNFYTLHRRRTKEEPVTGPGTKPAIDVPALIEAVKASEYPTGHTSSWKEYLPAAAAVLGLGILGATAYGVFRHINGRPSPEVRIEENGSIDRKLLPPAGKVPPDYYTTPAIIHSRETVMAKLGEGGRMNFDQALRDYQKIGVEPSQQEARAAKIADYASNASSPHDFMKRLRDDSSLDLGDKIIEAVIK